MSRFFSRKYADLVPYTPGEEPKEKKFVKLNTNESPFPPSPLAVKMASEAARELMLYPDPDCRTLTAALAEKWNLLPEEIIWTNGSDDVLNFAFMAFCDREHPALFPDITYGFYSVFARVNGIPFQTVPLKEDFSLCVSDYCGRNQTIFIANPNAPTGLCLSTGEIEKILSTNTDSVVVIDEAYVDFGGESCIPLIRKYGNLLVTQTFSKSRSMAGARLGFAAGCPDLIRDLNTIRYSPNPYNNRMTMAAGIGSLRDDAYRAANCEKIIENREYTKKELRRLGFQMTDSKANFVFIRHREISGEDLYCRLKEKGVLVRHFSQDRINDYCRVTIGSREEMDEFLDQCKCILEEI